MGIVPKDKSKRISWYKVHVAKWAQDPAGIGTTPEQVAQVETLVEEARLARIEQYRAQQAAQAATQRLHNAMERLSSSGAAVMLQIRAHARSDPGVYAKASIPKPRKKSPLPAPGKPYDIEFEIDAVGWLTLSWKCDNPANAAGPMYQVWRQINRAGTAVGAGAGAGGAGAGWEYIGNVGVKKCIDKTLPRGIKSVRYKVQAARPTAAGEMATLDVNFGSIMPAHAGMIQRTKWDLRGAPAAPAPRNVAA